MSSLVRTLVLKDLYLARGIIIASIVGGVLGLVLMPWSPVAFYLGVVTFMVVLIIMNVALVMSAVIGERKEKIALFVLSLPISTTQYTLAKTVSSLIAFVAPWAVLSLGCLVLFDLTPIPNGMIPVSVALMVFMVLYFCVLLAVALLTDSGLWTGSVIVGGNVGVNILIQILLRLPSFVANGRGETAVWTADIVFLIALQLVLSAVVIGIALFIQSRKKDFV
jgi:ABC-type transport system involved in multi-copper enzyme maturation permease subunit